MHTICNGADLIARKELPGSFGMALGYPIYVLTEVKRQTGHIHGIVSRQQLQDIHVDEVA
jgi:hypothetical protein